MEESNYNRIYKKIILEEIPGYWQGKKKRKERMMIAGYRCGNEMREQYWRKEKKKLCRVCEKEEDFKHVIEKCEETKYEITLKEFFSGEEKGLETMRRIKRIRKERRKEREEEEKEEEGKEEM